MGCAPDMSRHGNIFCNISTGIHAALLCLLLAVMFAAQAEETSAEETPIYLDDLDPQASEPPLTEDMGLLETVDEQRDYLSQKIVTLSKGIDEFFGDKRYFQEHNHSVIQLGLNEVMDTGGNHQMVGEMLAKLDLPAAQRRFQLVLESNPEQKTANESRQDVAPQNKTTPKPEQYAASLRFERKEEERLHFSSELGAKFQFPLDPFARTRVSYSIPFDEWRLKLAETLFWFSSIGLGETSQIDLEHQLGPPVLFRATSTATCMEAPQNCDLRQDLTVYHTLSDRAVMQYQLSVLGISEPKLAETNYIMQTRFRYRLHKNWVFYEINPQISFPKTDYFRMNALLLLRLEVLFGATK